MRLGEAVELIELGGVYWSESDGQYDEEEAPSAGVGGKCDMLVAWKAIAFEKSFVGRASQRQCGVCRWRYVREKRDDGRFFSTR